MGLPAEKKTKPAAEYYYKEKIVKDIMKPMESLSAISADTAVKDAVYILKSSMAVQNYNSGYLLVFENKSLIGYVGIQEMFASVQPPNLRDDWFVGWNLSNWVEPTFMPGLFSSLCHEVAEKPVRDIMNPLTTMIRADSTLEEAVFKFYRERRDMFPVAENEKLVGVLFACDLFNEIYNAIF
ncbi:MAG: CBS domain-containing protein [Peptococcaceae bacterium]|nr:CBS domain-containing protein [Peptococcaceae bacterium]